jgi:hypothetical protein
LGKQQSPDSGDLDDSDGSVVVLPGSGVILVHTGYFDSLGLLAGNHCWLIYVALLGDTRRASLRDYLSTDEVWEDDHDELITVWTLTDGAMVRTAARAAKQCNDAAIYEGGSGEGWWPAGYYKYHIADNVLRRML